MQRRRSRSPERRGNNNHPPTAPPPRTTTGEAGQQRYGQFPSQHDQRGGGGGTARRQEDRTRHSGGGDDGYRSGYGSGARNTSHNDRRNNYNNNNYNNEGGNQRDSSSSYHNNNNTRGDHTGGAFATIPNNNNDHRPQRNYMPRDNYPPRRDMHGGSGGGSGSGGDVPPRRAMEDIARENSIQASLLQARDRGFWDVIRVLTTHDNTLTSYNSCNVSTALHALGMTRRKSRFPPPTDVVKSTVKSLFEIGSHQHEFNAVSINSAITGVTVGQLHHLAPEAWKTFSEKCVTATIQEMGHFKIWELVSVADQLRCLDVNVDELLPKLSTYLANRPFSAHDEREEATLVKLVQLFSSVSVPDVDRVLMKISDTMMALPNERISHSTRLIIDVICGIAKTSAAGGVARGERITTILEKWATRFQQLHVMDIISEMECARFVEAYAILQVPSSNLFTTLSNVLLREDRKLSKLDANTLSNVLWAFVVLDQPAPMLFVTIAKELLQRDLTNFPGNYLANVAWSFASMPIDANVLEPLFVKLATSTVQRTTLSDWTSQSLTNAAWAFSVAGVAGISDAFSKILDELSKRLDTLTPAELVFVLFAAANVGHVVPSTFYNMVAKTMCDIEARGAPTFPFTSLDMLDAMWAFSCAGMLREPEVVTFFTRPRGNHVQTTVLSDVPMDGEQRWRAVIEAWKLEGAVDRHAELCDAVSTLLTTRQGNLPQRATAGVAREVLDMLRNDDYMAELVSESSLLDLKSPQQSIGLVILNKRPLLSDGNTLRTEAEFLRRIITKSGEVARVEFIGMDEWVGLGVQDMKKALLVKLVGTTT